MLAKLKVHIESHHLFNTQNRLLIGVSAGVDSMVLSHLLKELHFNFIIAHMNFGLRGEESDLDSDFVEQWGRNNGIITLVSKVNTDEFVKKNQGSTQMAARSLRYNWFSELATLHKCSNILTAHHADDNLETVLFNLTKGTGIRGLRGIKMQQGLFVRPLLIFSKQEILNYAQERSVLWRKDISNLSNKYLRNNIRNKVLPVLKNINPSVLQTFRDTQTRLLASEMLLDQKVLDLKAQFFKPGLIDCLEVSWVRDNPLDHLLLFELLKSYQLGYAQFKQIFRSVVKNHSAMFYWNKYQLNVDRQKVWIGTTDRIIDQVAHKEITNGSDAVEFCNYRFTFNYLTFTTEFINNNSLNIAFLDLERLTFPLILRKWEKGDYFYPLGMDHKKKVSDFLVDQKIPRIKKERLLILVSKKEICWLVGLRIDERFKLKKSTKGVVQIVVKDLNSNEKDKENK
jgi:tRNA(Ile)-lysidine synthase